VAAALTLAASEAVGAQDRGGNAALAFLGTLVVYNVDRLRDVERDLESKPDRSAFVQARSGLLAALAAAAFTAAATLALLAGPGTQLICGSVLAVGLLHRRLKRAPVVKSLYVTTAWVAVVVGLPALAGGDLEAARWTAAVFAAAVGANVVASDLRDASPRGEPRPRARTGPWHLGTAMTQSEQVGTGPWHRATRLAKGRGGARLLAAGGIALALIAPENLAALGWVPAAVLASLLGFRPGERYGMAVVDGSLLVGALATLAALPR